MSTDSRFVSQSIEEMLVAIADGVREAQEALSQAPSLDAQGRPMPLYHLPHLDFEIKVGLETVSVQGGRSIFKVRPTSSTDSKELSSTISGRLIAVPPGEGLPVPRIEMASTQLAARKFTIQLGAFNTAGEWLANTKIELNIDMEASIDLSKAVGVALTTKGETNVADAVLLTNKDGTAATTLTVDKKVRVGAILMLTAELGNSKANLSVTIGVGK